jgi:hypothetical protein
MKYQTLLELRIQHDYYADTICQDFTLDPTEATRQLLRNHRCVYRLLPDGIRLSIAVTEQDVPYITLPQNLALNFHLKCLNPDFALFTDLTAYQRAINPTYTNSGALSLVLESRLITVTESLVLTQSLHEETFVLRSQPAPGFMHEDFKVSGLNKLAKLVRYDPLTRTITIEGKPKKNPTPTPFTITYPTAASANPYFAAVELCHDSSSPVPFLYTLIYTAKQARWNYIVLTNKEEGTFNIQDQEEPAIQFVANAHPSAQVDALAIQFPRLRHVQLISEKPIVYRQSARKGLCLSIDKQLVMRALPNPSPRNLSFITVGQNSGQREEVLWQVIKYVVQ